MGGRVIERGGDFICGMNAEDAVGYDLRHKCRGRDKSRPYSATKAGTSSGAVR